MRRKGRTKRGPATLSVVVPVYNVARYLAECLDSILRQPVTDIQVVVVDDGSTDESPRILRDYAAREPRMLVIRQPNCGVSIARNVAIEHCTGEFLTFVDPDDVLPDDAWSTMLATLRRTGSDFAVGSAERLDGDRRFITPLMRRNHREERLGIRIEDQPLMLADVFVWNKVFRRAFWEEAALHFPERTRYQDQPALTQAFLSARRFDVLTEVVYDWVVRPSGGSATQRRRDLDNLQERISTKRTTVELVVAYGDPEIERVLRTEILPIDMWEHFRAARGAGDDYWVVLRDAVREFWSPDTVPFEETTVPVQQRLMGWLVAQDRRQDLERLLDFLDSPRRGPIVVDGEFRHPWRDEPGLPSRVTVA